MTATSGENVTRRKLIYYELLYKSVYCSALYLALSVEFGNFFEFVRDEGAARLDMVLLLWCCFFVVWK